MNQGSTIYALARESRLGWFAVAGDESAIQRVVIGHAVRVDALEALAVDLDARAGRATEVVRQAADAITRYFEGEPVDLGMLPVETGPRTPFQQRVVRALRRVPYGNTVSYAELAESAGAPRAARAVGAVMSQNRLPLVIPCHRVIGSGGRLGGFSAPQGIALKQALLEMEAGRRVTLGIEAPTAGARRSVRSLCG